MNATILEKILNQTDGAEINHESHAFKWQTGHSHPHPPTNDINNTNVRFAKPNSLHRILVADDEPLMRQLNTEALTDSGYQVDEVEDGAVAWETLQLKRYHLLITDNQMPKMSGVDLLKKLHAARMGVPVIMATGTLPREEFTRSPWIQPVAVLLKPYTLTELLGAVKKVMQTTSDARAQT